MRVTIPRAKLAMLPGSGTATSLTDPLVARIPSKRSGRSAAVGEDRVQIPFRLRGRGQNLRKGDACNTDHHEERH